MKKMIFVGYAPACVQANASSTKAGDTVLINSIEELPQLKGYEEICIDGDIAVDHELTLAVLHAADAEGMEIILRLPSAEKVLLERDFFRHILTDYVDSVMASESAAMAYAFGGGDLNGIKDPALTAAAIMARTCRDVVMKLEVGGMILHYGAEEEKWAGLFKH